MKPEKAISLLQRGIVGEIYDEKGYLTALGYEALDAIDGSKCPTLVQRPHGKWEKKSVYSEYFYCSECGYAYKHAFNFCPNCGALMISSNSEIEKSKSEIVPDYRDGWRLKEGDEK